jgi:hypothetical protein
MARLLVAPQQEKTWVGGENSCTWLDTASPERQHVPPSWEPLMSSRSVCTLIALLAAPFPAMAQEHLVPEDSQFTRADLPPNATLLAPYHEMIITVLEDAFAEDVRARLIAMPSFSPEYALGLKETDGAWSIFHFQSEVQLWSYENLRMLRDFPADLMPSQAAAIDEAIAGYDAELPDDYHDVGTGAACETPIPAALGEDLLALWTALLLETRYGDIPNLGRDGTDYHFSMRRGGRLMAGKVWEPAPESAPGAMVSITETMRNLCFTADANLLAQLEPQVESLLARLED